MISYMKTKKLMKTKILYFHTKQYGKMFFTWLLCGWRRLVISSMIGWYEECLSFSPSNDQSRAICLRVDFTLSESNEECETCSCIWLSKTLHSINFYYYLYINVLNSLQELFRTTNLTVLFVFKHSLTGSGYFLDDCSIAINAQSCFFQHLCVVRQHSLVFIWNCLIIGFPCIKYAQCSSPSLQNI